ncbi:hypothetical protein BMS3Abin15_00811 [bacterium BMS3Abin15]|nr:hypothetical protein BMS3Abin15_00811 [bacterium BMS3Abin15]HDZ85377.1 hypothetical protein [Candidatus Moranbacteria bacterium]
MKIIIENVKDNPANIMRRAGYAFQRHEWRPASTRGDTRRREAGEMSFVRPLARAGFPRFHAFTKLENANLSINIHLDQKRETYGNASRHHGEYEDEGALREEIDRIRSVISSL